MHKSFRARLVAVAALSTAVSMWASTALGVASVYSQAFVAQGDGQFLDGTFPSSTTMGETVTATKNFTHATPSGSQVYDGTASATTTYQQLKSSTSATLANTYNDPTYTFNGGGVPTDYDTHAVSRFTETLQYGGTAVNYTSTYKLHLTGSLLRDSSPDLEDNGDGSKTFLGAQVTVRLRHADQATKVWSFRTAGSYAMDLFSQAYVHGASPQTFFLEVITNTHFSTTGVANGSTVTGAANFGNTLELVGVDLRNAANGQFLANETVTRESGGTLAVVLTPEPTTILTAGAVMLGLLRRRR